MRHEQLSKEAHTLGVWNPEAVARGLGFMDADVAHEMLAEDEEEDFLSEIMRNADQEEIQAGNVPGTAGPPPESKFFPYPNEMIFLLDVLDNLPRLRISGSLMRVILWILKQAHCKDVPSFDLLRRVQKSIRSDCGVPTIPCKSVQGNVFFMNDPAAIIAQDWANPMTRKLIHVYPEIPKDGIIREIWHAQKWRSSMDLDMLSPMYDSGSSHYYVNEVARLKSGIFVIPIRWVVFDDKVHADVFSVVLDEKEATIITKETTLVSSAEFRDNYLDLEHAGEIPAWSHATIQGGHDTRMPNPKRAIAGGDPMYVSMVDYFSDDVSGNRTKSWNKHWNAYMTHRNLPRQVLQQEFHTHFISTSPKASVTEQFKEATHTEPVKVRDETGATTRFCLHVNSGPSDNPMQSEIAGHIGGKGNRYCRKCEAGGTGKEKATNEGYHALFEPGIPRTKEGVLEELKKQVRLACSGVAQPVKDLQTETGVKDTYTQYWIDQLIGRFKEMKKADPARLNIDIERELVEWTQASSEQIYSGFLTMKGFDPTRDTPVEILHTILLGIVKYIWHISHTTWSEENKRAYSLRLQSTNTDGLSIHAIRSNYIMQYAGSLIGRQFKTIVQTNIFHVHGIVTDEKFKAWRATGELAALLWVPEIRNLPEYRADLKVAVANVLDIFAAIDPSKIITKIKYHLLVHIEDDAVEIGPLIGAITEIFECFNAIFRFCSILSNHLAPSRDIAIQLGDQEGMKHRLTGGWWQHSVNGWRRAGPGVRHFMAEHPVLQKLLGWSSPQKLIHGEAKLAPLPRGQKERVKYELRATNASLAVNFGLHSAESHWLKCRRVISESLDECFIHSWVFAVSPIDPNSTIIGRISDILLGERSEVLVVLEIFQVLSVRDPRVGMPVLVRRDSEITFSILPAKNIRFKINVQHDCHTAKCEATGIRLQMQERVESDQIENYIVHNPLDRYFINSHSFHNAHLLRATLPRDLIAPISLFEDRQQTHFDLATTLRATLETRREKLKAAAALRPNKRKAAAKDNCPPKRQKKLPATSTEPSTGRTESAALTPVAELATNRRPQRTIVKSSRARMAEDNEREEEQEDDDEEDPDEAVLEFDDDLYQGSDDDYSD
ncbi:hypothetical protein B0H19DRAFT_1297712 [Mycena capillaripes]|nr:hypothetical protein B0H19DRAFT_1297712 [Mycena capillaripes]